MGDFFDKAKKLGAKAYDQAEDALEVGRYKAKISSKKGDMEESYKKIGQYLYEKYSEGGDGEGFDQTVMDAFREIDSIVDEIMVLEEKIEAVKKG